MTAVRSRGDAGHRSQPARIAVSLPQNPDHDRHHRQQGLRQGRHAHPRHRHRRGCRSCWRSSPRRSGAGWRRATSRPARTRFCTVPGGKGEIDLVLTGVRDARRSLGARAPAAQARAGALLPRQGAGGARRGQGRVRLGARKLPVHALQEGAPQARRPAARPFGESGRGARARGGGEARARPREHAGGGHGSRGALRHRARAGGPLRRGVRRVGGRRVAGAELPGHPCRGPRGGARAATARAQLGQPEASAPRHRRQGRVLRHRRPRHQGRRGHAPHEEGHGRRRARDRAGAARDAAEAPLPPAAPRAGRRERDRRQRLSPGRRGAHAPWPHGRDRQHRCRGPRRPVRCARLRGGGQAQARDRLRHPHGRGARGARAGAAGAVRERREVRGEAPRGERGGRGSGLAPAAVAQLPAPLRQRHRGLQQLRQGRLRRRHRRRALPRLVRAGVDAVGALRHLRVERHLAPGTSAGRGCDGPARGAAALPRGAPGGVRQPLCPGRFTRRAAFRRVPRREAAKARDRGDARGKRDRPNHPAALLGLGGLRAPRGGCLAAASLVPAVVLARGRVRGPGAGRPRRLRAAPPGHPPQLPGHRALPLLLRVHPPRDPPVLHRGGHRPHAVLARAALHHLPARQGRGRQAPLRHADGLLRAALRVDQPLDRARGDREPRLPHRDRRGARGQALLGERLQHLGHELRRAFGQRHPRAERGRAARALLPRHRRGLGLPLPPRARRRPRLGDRQRLLRLPRRRGPLQRGALRRQRHLRTR